jgi:alpha-D-xyloside xylohydrolase
VSTPSFVAGWSARGRQLQSVLRIVGAMAAALVAPVAGEAGGDVPGGAQLTAAGQTVRVQFYAGDVVRVLKWTAGGDPEKQSLVVIARPDAGLAITHEETAETLTVASAKLRVRLSKADGVVRFESPEGASVLAEARPASFTPVTTPFEKAWSVAQAFRLTPDEGIYGLGQHQEGGMNCRGRAVKLVQTNTDAVTPVVVSTRGWGLLWDNDSKTQFEDGASGASLWSEVADNLDYYFFFGPSLDAVVAGYRRLTGPAPLYGKWAYGYWQSKEHYHTQDELLKVAEEYRRRRIPIDSIVQDWNYWGSLLQWGGMIFDPERYPRPDEMVKRLHDLKYHLMISIWPGLGPETAIHKEMAERGFLYAPVGWAGFRYYDAFNPEANALYFGHLDRGLRSKGIDAWWIDSTEPDVINALTKESSEYELKKMGHHHLGSWHRHLNSYSLAMMDALHANLRRQGDDRRVYLLTRSAFAGQQRTGATTWSGDIGSSWDIYRKQIAAGLNFSMSGIPYWTFDIGGFVIASYGGTFSRGGKDPAYQELYTRMFQFGAFCPIFRSHGSDTPREIWELGQFAPTLVKYDRLRYRLLPYIYSLAWQVTSQGYTMLRGLPMDFPADRGAHDVADQFLFGPALMVSPVTEYQLHRPPEPSVLVPPASFRTPDGKPGLLARYYKDTAYKVLGLERVDPNVDVFWYTGRPDYVTDSTLSIRWDGQLVPTQSGPHQFHIKAFGTRRIVLDGRELPFVWPGNEPYTQIVTLEAGRAYPLRVELENGTSGALRMQLHWKTPEIFARERVVEARPRTRPVYLPAGTGWTDFWTGASHAGGRTIVADAPIETLPLLVRAGSIVPLGPELQYATEKPADPIELRVYTGADGGFTLYEDENDGYAYEKGVHATIALRWDDARRQLTLEERQGQFPGMLGSRTFQVVLVREGHGTGGDATAAPDRVVTYDGKRQVVSF